MKVITMSPLKGGTAKTTTAINLAGYLSKNNRVLIIDLDGQRNASNFFKLQEQNKTIYDVLVNHMDIKSAIYPSRFPQIDYCHGSKKMGDSKVSVNSVILKEALQSVYKDYEYVIIDNAPILNKSVIASFVVSDKIIMTCELDRFSGENIVDMINNIMDEKSKANIYITPVRVVTNSKLHRSVRRELEHLAEEANYIQLTDSLVNSIEISNMLYDGKILVNEKAPTKSSYKLQKGIIKVAEEVK